MNDNMNQVLTSALASLNHLTRCSQEIFSRPDLEQVYDAILACGFAVLPDTKICLLLIVDYVNDRLTLTRVKGIDLTLIENSSIAVGTGISGKVARDGHKQVSNAIKNFSEFIPEKILVQNGIERFISLPIKVADHIIGVLNFYLAKSIEISPVDATMLELLATNAASAIQYINLYQNDAHTRADMDFVIQIARDISSTLDFKRVLDHIISASQQIANANITSIYYKDIVTAEWKRKVLPEVKIASLELPKIDQGEGIIGHVLKTGRLYHCQDVTGDRRYFNTWKETRSELAIPLIIDNEVKGVLNVESKRINGFSKRQVKLLTLLAEECAIALRNAQLFEIAEMKTKQFITLREISEALGQQKSLDDILTIIAKESYNLVGRGQKVVYVLLIDKEKKMLETRAAWGELFNREHSRFSILLSEKSIVTWVARNAAPRICSDVTKDREYFALTRETKSELCIPLIFRKEVIGVVNIESSELAAFDDEDEELLQTLAENSAIATKIAELCDVRLKQLEALTKIGTKINASLNLNDVLNTIANEALWALGPRNRTFYVQLLDEDKGILEIKVVAGVGRALHYVGTQITTDQGISGWVVKNKRYYLSSCVKIDPYYLKIDPTVQSELCIPIIFGDKVIGLLNTESYERNDFGEHELELLQGLADQAGVAIENARLSEGLACTQYQLTNALGIALIGETLAGLTHDIRTASSLISGEAQWIQHQYEENKLALDEAVQAMKKIEHYVERIERLTEDLVQQAQRAPIEFAFVNIADVIKECVYLTANQAYHQCVDIDIDYPSLQFMAKVDARRLKRVVINIVVNAIEAMPDGGRLTIKAFQEENFFETWFIDTGAGISEQDLQRVWETFFTTKPHGSGLGLAICKRIIESDHNGRISIESEKGRGTTLKIKLPMNQNYAN